MKFIEIKSAKYLEDYKISFKFSDGHSSIVDFQDFILNDKSPYTKPFRNLDKFKQFEIKHGRDISWKDGDDDYAMCFQFKTLYKGGVISPVSQSELKRGAVEYFGKKKAEEIFA